MAATRTHTLRRIKALASTLPHNTLATAAAMDDGSAAALSAEAAAVPLSQQYDEAVRLFEACQSTDRGDAALRRALQALEACEAAVERAALFSSNEDADDVATGSLRYLLLPSMRGELLSGAPAGGPDGMAARARHVEAALDAFGGFLSRAARLGVLKGAAAAAAAAAGFGGDGSGDDGEDDEGDGSGGSSGRRRALVAAASAAAAMDPGARRAAKIERFKRAKALQAAVAQLKRQRDNGAQGSSSRGGGAGGGDDDAEEDVPAGGPGGGWDEADERRLWLLQLEGAALAALDAREALLQERQLLRHHLSSQAGDAGASAASRAESGRGASTSGAAGDARLRPSARAAAAAAAGAVGGPAERAAMMAKLSGIAEALTLGERDRWRQNVFKPYVPLPTLTVEQQGEIELREARAREAKHAEAEAAKRAKEAARRSDDEDDDEEVAKARAWDEFKDDNPRGWGNSKLRPCA